MDLGVPSLALGFREWLWGLQHALPPQWHSLSREEQAKYYELARKERQLHSQLYPTWSARDNYVRVAPAPFPGSGWWEGAGCAQGSVFRMLVAVSDCAKSLQVLWGTASRVCHHSIPHGGQKPRKELKSSFPGQEKEAKA